MVLLALSLACAPPPADEPDLIDLTEDQTPTMPVRDAAQALRVLELIEGQPRRADDLVRWITALRERARVDGAAPCPSEHAAGETGWWDAGEGCVAADGSEWSGRLWRMQQGASEVLRFEGLSLRYDPAQDPLAGPLPADRLVTLELDGELRSGAEYERVALSGVRHHPEQGAWFHDEGQAGDVELSWSAESADWAEGWLALSENPAAPELVGGLRVEALSRVELRLVGADTAELRFTGPCWSVAINGAEAVEACP